MTHGQTGRPENARHLQVSAGTLFRPGPVLSILRGASWPKMAAKAPEISSTLQTERTSRWEEEISPRGSRGWHGPPPAPRGPEKQRLRDAYCLPKKMGSGQPASAWRRRIQAFRVLACSALESLVLPLAQGIQTSGGERNSWRQVSGWQCGCRELWAGCTCEESLGRRGPRARCRGCLSL